MQQRGEGAGNVPLVGSDQSGVGANAFHDHAGGQQVAIDVQNISAARFEHQLALSISQSLGAERLVTKHLQVDKTIPKPRKSRAQQESKPNQPPILYFLGHKTKSPAAHDLGSSSGGSRAAAKIYIV
jgi:hypothetical protein